MGGANPCEGPDGKIRHAISPIGIITSDNPGTVALEVCFRCHLVVVDGKHQKLLLRDFLQDAKERGGKFNHLNKPIIESHFGINIEEL